MVPARAREAPVDEAAPAFRGGALKRSTPPKSLYKGLAWDRQEQCWRVRISFNGKQRHVGRCAGWGGPSSRRGTLGKSAQPRIHASRGVRS
jgi:hypothetical protein